MLMIDGPGPSGRVTPYVRVAPASVALMTSGPDPILATQRILLFLSCNAGERSASRSAHKIATMFPASPSTCGIATSGGVNPLRAHTGSELTGGCPAHPFQLPAPACVVPARAALTVGWLLPLQAAKASRTASASTMVLTMLWLHRNRRTGSAC